MTPIVTTVFSAFAQSATRLKPGAKRFFSPAFTSSNFQTTIFSSAFAKVAASRQSRARGRMVGRGIASVGVQPKLAV